MESPDDPQVFHPGERRMQASVGVRDRMAAIGAHAIRTSMPEQHRTFFAQLPFVMVGSMDAEGQPWASILTNPPGFIGSPDARHLLIRARPTVADPLHETLAPGAPIALLGIEQSTRRRNRMNGIVERMDDDGLLVGVQQSFGNCPKYIQARQVDYRAIESSGTVHSATALNESTRQIIARADTLFIATAHPGAHHGTARSYGVDVSHRGGKPGFVRADDDATLTLPDFAGNRFFNTLGNIMLNPRAGLLFIDFETGDLLYLAAEAQIVFDSPELDAFAGAERLLRFKIRHVRHVVASLPLHWSREVEISPFLADTGEWERI
ncbi:pyridoxamine 5'-phosphate oxidase family protein [Thiobacillus sp.]|uniref:pyridoxamine 5'-phosphate oxidase family protein n=1 Tax=Thiobacillus sp. TaxID=924 RepID=UPI0011D8F614|nr:pyridoxamine 5'-phosphate oxidase family protein [Thiobacillus sp.]TXH75321.1 MAG: flavin-nucleotide-binding protein [Thiobacillus sp.]